METFKAERSLKEDHKNVDNRIQYVGQIGSEGKHSGEEPKKTKVKISSSDEERRTESL